MSSPARYRLVLDFLVFLLSFAYLLPGIERIAGTLDEGIAVYGAQRVLSGDVPYRDFWTAYGPGQFYILASLFRVFGSSLIVHRLWDTAVLALLASLAYSLASSLTSRRAALLTWALVLSWVGYIGPYGYGMFTALLCGLFSMCTTASALKPGASRPALRFTAGGAWMGLATLLRHDVGFNLLVGQLAAGGVLAWYERQPAAAGVTSSVPPTPRNVRRGLHRWLAGMAVVLLPSTAYFVGTVPIGLLLNDLLAFPLNVFPRVRAIPYPTPLPDPSRLFSGESSMLSYLWEAVLRFPFYFPFLVFAGAVLLLAQRGRTHRPSGPAWLWMAVTALATGLLFAVQGTTRSDKTHVVPMLVAAALLLPVMMQELSSRAGRAARLAHGAALLLVAAVVVVPVHGRGQALVRSWTGHPALKHQIERARWVEVDSDRAGAIRYVMHHAPRDQSIYVGNVTHDRIWANDVMFYFLAERRSATRYHELHPGVATRLPVQRQIVADLARQNIQYVVLCSGMQTFKEPNESAISSGVRFLDDYLRRHYRPVAHFGDYTVWRRFWMGTRAAG